MIIRTETKQSPPSTTYLLALLFLLVCTPAVRGQAYATNSPRVETPPKEPAKAGANQEVVYYSDFGAKGDGQTDDIDAIAAAHAYANQNGLPVRADDKATYYIGGKERTVSIQTNTTFGTASFVIDDTGVENRRAPVFRVSSDVQATTLETISSLEKNQKRIAASLGGPSLIRVVNTNVKQYIRLGSNQDSGSSQTDIFLVDKDGNVDPTTPIIWDFDQVTSMTALPIYADDELTITGGHFTTIANQDASEYNYYDRNFEITRSYVTVDGMQHDVTGEGAQGAPYAGFLDIYNCAYVTVKNTTLTGHKTYFTTGSAGTTVAMGSYDISVGNTVNVSFVNCDQTNDINDGRYWGIMGSNHCKNLLYDGCTLSRFDAHRGVNNATVRNSTLGHMGINAIGGGTFTVENTTVRANNFINLRPDYGSSWQGEFIIRDCIFVPNNGRSTAATLIGGYNSSSHDFGYTSYLPEQITIENLVIDDSNHPAGYQGPAIFADFNPKLTDASYPEPFPYIRTGKVILDNVTTASGEALRLSDNLFMFKDVELIYRQAQDPSTSSRWEAEAAILSQALVQSNHAGFSGDGFVDYANLVGSYVEWKVQIAKAGAAALAFRYASGSATNRRCELVVDGKVIAAPVSFPGTGGWASWGTSQVTIDLAPGEHTIRLKATTEEGGPNVDYLQVLSPREFSEENGQVVIRAGGDCGTEIMVLRVSGQEVARWTDVSTGLTDYLYEGYRGGDIEVAFVNDQVANCDRNLKVDYVDVCGQRYQTETQATETSTCCKNIADKLFTNGNFNFGNLGCTSTVPKNQSVSTALNNGAVSPAADFTLYPNPSPQGGRLMLRRATEEAADGLLYDARGQLLRRLPLRGKESQLDITGLPSGVYFLYLDTQHVSQVRRFVIH